MPKLSFENYAQWAEWTSTVSSVNPFNQVIRRKTALSGKRGGMAAETMARIIFDTVEEACREGHFSIGMPAVEETEVQEELGEILQPHALNISFEEKISVISCEHFSDRQPSSPYALADMPFGKWAYWLAESVHAKPTEKFTKTDENRAARLQSPRRAEWIKIEMATVAGEMEVTVAFHHALTNYLLILRNDFRINGLTRFVEASAPDGSREFRIQLRRPPAQAADAHD
jgi:hypothetical protein